MNPLPGGLLHILINDISAKCVCVDDKQLANNNAAAAAVSFEEIYFRCLSYVVDTLLANSSLNKLLLFVQYYTRIKTDLCKHIHFSGAQLCHKSFL